MKIDVVFDQTDMELQLAFDTIIPVDIGSKELQSLIDGTVAGEYVSNQVTHLKQAAFSQCRNLTYISLPNCVQLDSFRTFFQCEKVTGINLPRLAEIGDGTYTFSEMKKLKEITLPSLTTVGSTTASMFRHCNELTKIHLPQLGGTTIQSYMFSFCYDLHTLVLGGSALNPLANTNAFHSAGTTAKSPLRIYVPDDLVDAYKSATNWSVFADKIKPMSELEA